MGLLSLIQLFLNSTALTPDAQPLDVMLKQYNSQTFTEDGVFTVPPNVYKIIITACGGGGGGGKGYQNSSGTVYGTGAGGGGGALIHKKVFPVHPGDLIPITIGIGGVEATNGAPTIIGDLITLPGGGAGPNNYARDGKGGDGGNEIAGGGGGVSYAVSGTKYTSLQGKSYLQSPNAAFGGSSILAAGGMGEGGGGASIGSGGNPGNPGELGGGGGGGNTNGSAGSKGGDGIVIIEW